MNNTLPIYGSKDIILKTIKENRVTIIVAETGSGKSTQVPQMLLSESSYDIVVTQPRTLAAKSIAKRVNEEMGTKLGELIGFRTAFDKKDSKRTRCLFCTDGLQLVRELTQARFGVSDETVLIIDEVHEWNLNIEMLVAWCKKKLSESKMRIVLMSATFDHERLSSYFNGAAVVNVPGKVYPVIGSPSHENGLIQKPSRKLANEIKDQVSKGRSVLVFLPGKQEIVNVRKELTDMYLPAEILDLYSDLDPEEQDKVFISYMVPKVILSTNIAQTSLTVPDIDVVIDSGMERRVELQDGIETLVLGVISKADAIQRAGRAGRVKKGYYILCNDLEFKNFTEYPIPEIMRSDLDHMVLRLMSAGIDPAKIEFYHQPDQEVIMNAKLTLVSIGALDKYGITTKLGEQISILPAGVKLGRMIIEAASRECLEPILTIAAILETNFKTIRRKSQTGDSSDFKSWQEMIDKKSYASDLLVELELFRKAEKLDLADLEKNGISLQMYLLAKERKSKFEKIIDYLWQCNSEDLNRNSENEETILKCILSGMISHLYKKVGKEVYKNSEPHQRKLNKMSTLDRTNLPEWIVGVPLNLDNSYGKAINYPRLLIHCTSIKLEWVTELASNSIEEKLVGLTNPKAMLESKARKCLKTIPSYLLLDQSGPINNPIVKVGIFFGDVCIAQGLGSTEQEAQQRVSRKVLASFNWPE